MSFRLWKVAHLCRGRSGSSCRGGRGDWSTLHSLDLSTNPKKTQMFWSKLVRKPCNNDSCQLFQVYKRRLAESERISAKNTRNHLRIRILKHLCDMAVPRRLLLRSSGCQRGSWTSQEDSSSPHQTAPSPAYAKVVDNARGLVLTFVNTFARTEMQYIHCYTYCYIQGLCALYNCTYHVITLNMESA